MPEQCLLFLADSEVEESDFSLPERIVNPELDEVRWKDRGGTD